MLASCIAHIGGISVQTRMWKEGLDNNGDEVDLFSPWEFYDWNDYIIKVPCFH